jgi:hypothetical protein
MTEFDQFLSQGQHFDAGLLFWDNECGWDRVHLELESFARLLAAWASKGLTQQQSRQHMRLLAPAQFATGELHNIRAGILAIYLLRHSGMLRKGIFLLGMVRRIQPVDLEGKRSTRQN